MNSLQQVQLNILLELERVCRKNDIRYFLFSGTLLGAVRHQGFIPWDDDIDVVMLRDEYERFVHLPQSEFQEKFFLQTSETDKEYDNVYAKLRDSTTTYVESYVANRNINHGVFIDIFPMDGFPCNPLLQNIFWWSISVFGYAATLKAFIKEPKEHLRGPFTAIKKVIPLSGATMMRIYGKMVRMVCLDTSSKIGFLTHPGFPIKHIVYDRSMFDNVTTVRFEGHELPAPAEYSSILSKLFGDYMDLPPMEQRTSHHGADALSTTTPFSEACEES